MQAQARSLALTLAWPNWNWHCSWHCHWYWHCHCVTDTRIHMSMKIHACTHAHAYPDTCTANAGTPFTAGSAGSAQPLCRKQLQTVAIRSILLNEMTVILYEDRFLCYLFKCYYIIVHLVLHCVVASNVLNMKATLLSQATS